MSNPVFPQLESKIDQALETIELLRLQLDEAEERYASLLTDNSALKNRQVQWENNLAALLRKLEGADLSNSLDNKRVQAFEAEEAIA